MRHIYLIARREYLAYVSSWRFWLGLLLIPFIIAISSVGPILAMVAQPERYYTVITDDPALEAAFERGLTSGRRDAYAAAVVALTRTRGLGPEAERRAADAFDKAETPEAGLAAAAAELGLPGAGAIPTQRFGMVRVDPPTQEPGALRPYLLGHSTIATPQGPRPLFAAIFLRRDADGGVAVDYWSTSRTDRTLINLAQRSMHDLLRAEALAAAGVSTETVAAADRLAPKMTELNPTREVGQAKVTLADFLPHVVGVAFGYFLWLVIFSTANILLTSIIEEKGNKILEALLASARYHEILAGKLVGVALVSLTFILVWAGFGALGLTSVINAGVHIPKEITAALLDPGLLIPFAAYFILGYFMLGSIFLALGSLCETIQEAQTMMMPLMFVLIAPMLMMPVAIRSPDAPVLQIMSWIPLYTPFLMIVRLPSGLPLWEIVGTSVLLVVFVALVLWGAGGVFRAGVIGGAKPASVKRMLGRLAGRRAAAAGTSS